jgi:hypothetical protein
LGGIERGGSSSLIEEGVGFNPRFYVGYKMVCCTDGRYMKRDNRVKSEQERLYYQLLSRVRRIIETRFAQLEEFRAWN